MKETDTDIEALIAGCRRGDAPRQKALYDLYSPRLYALCCRLTGDREMAKDVCIEAFCKVFRHFDTYRGDGPLEAWIRRIFVRTAVAELKAARRSQGLSLDEVQGIAAQSHTLETRLSVKETLSHALARLDAEQRLVFNLVAIEGYTFDATASLCGMSVQSAKRRYYKARQVMQQTFQEYGITAIDE